MTERRGVRLLLLVLLALPARAQAPQPITVQLNWVHGYQFAGFYSALDLGLYRDLGLDVQLSPRDAFQDPVLEVIHGRAQFGVGNTDLLARRAAGMPVVVLAAIQQQQPHVLLTRRGEGLDTPQDLVGRRILFNPRQGGTELAAMFLAEGVAPDSLLRVDPRVAAVQDPIRGLESGVCDAAEVFTPKAAARHPDFRERFHVIDPSAYGLEFYGDCLFTSEKMLRDSPEVVEDFLAATLQGWKMAMAHRRETAQLIVDRYLPQETLEAVLLEGQELENCIRSRQVEIGHMNRGRWEHIGTHYRRLGMIEAVPDLDDFLYAPPDREGAPPPGVGMLAGLLSVLVVILTVSLVWMWRRRNGGHQDLMTLPVELARQIAKREEIQRQLSAAEDLLRQGMDGMGAALWDWNLRSRELFLSRQFLLFTGYERDELSGNLARSLSLIHPDDLLEARARFDSYLNRGSEDCSLEFRLRCKDGAYRWVHTRALATWDDDGQPLRVSGSVSDITGRIHAEEERDRLFNLSIDMLSVSGFDGFMQQVNPAWVRVLGWSRDDLMAHPILFFVHPEDQESSGEAFRQLAAGRPLDGLQNRFRCRNGSYRWLAWSSFPYQDIRLAFSVVRDITHQKEAEFKLLDYQDRLRSLSNQLALVEDRQRRQLAAAIHDNLAQQLFGLRAKVTLLKYPEKLADQQSLVAEILEVLDGTMQEARSLSFELFPPVLHEVGLEAALTWLAHHFEERTGISTRVAVEGSGDELAEDLRSMAYQCVRELLANVSKHSQAEKVDITLNYVDTFLTILVDDDGSGFDASAEDLSSQLRPEQGGFGLFSIRERLRSVEGRMLVDTRPGEGCRVFLSFPLNPSSG